MAIIPPVLNPNPWAEPLYPIVQPFTYRDGTTHLEILKSLSNYVQSIAEIVNATNSDHDSAIQDKINDLIGVVNESLSNQAGAVNSALEAQTNQVDSDIQALTEYVNNAVDDVINSSIEVSDNVIVAILNDPESGVTTLIDTKYAKQSDHSALSNTVGVNVVDIAALKSNVTTINGNVDSLETAVTGLEGVVGDTATQVDGMYENMVTDDDLFFSLSLNSFRDGDNAVGAATWAYYFSIFTAPYKLRILSCDMSFDINQNGPYLVLLRRQRAGAAVDIASKSTTAEAIVGRKAWSFAGSNWDNATAVLEPGDVLLWGVRDHEGAGKTQLPVNITVRYERMP